MLKTLTRTVLLPRNALQSFHTSSIVRLREMYVEEKDKKTTIFGARKVESPRKPYLLKLDRKDGKCPLCQLKLDLKYTDVLILNQFLNSKGEVMPKFETQLCEDQYILVKKLIHMAQYAGLLPGSTRVEIKPYHLLNTYYDEKTIDLHPKRRNYNTHPIGKLKLGPIEKGRVKPDLGIYFGRKYV